MTTVAWRHAQADVALSDDETEWLKLRLQRKRETPP